MPRQKRLDVAGEIYHALNRGNAREDIFHKAEDYAAFERVLGEGLERYAVRLFSFTLMPNHWHMVLQPDQDGQMGRMLRWQKSKGSGLFDASSEPAILRECQDHAVLTRREGFITP